MTRRRALLTARQAQVLTYAANGHTNARIGSALYITKDTVNSILCLAYRNLGAEDRAHAVALALRYREIELADIHLPDQSKDAAA